MGDSTGSMFYFFVWIILLYVVGMGIYTIFTQLKKRRKQRRLRQTGKEVIDMNASDVIVGLVVIVLLGAALRGALRHFKGESTCCGGGGDRVSRSKKSLDGPV